VSERDEMARRIFEAACARELCLRAPVHESGAVTIESFVKQSRAAADLYFAHEKPAPAPAELQLIPVLNGISPQPQCCGGPMKYRRDAPDGACALDCPRCNRMIEVRAVISADMGGTVG